MSAVQSVSTDEALTSLGHVFLTRLVLRTNMCSMCLIGLHASCLMLSCECSHGSDLSQPESDHSPTSSPDDSPQDSSLSRYEGRETESRGGSNRGGTKRDAALKDQQSTGRKRAARLYPLDREADCEWKSKANCGGGKTPILGCVSGKQESRHHGPDKSTSNNEPGNVHRICHGCHNRWHAANNGEYDWNDTLVTAHNSRPQTEDEKKKALDIYIKYATTKQKRIKD